MNYNMKKVLCVCAAGLVCFFGSREVSGQAVKTNAPLLLAGTPNIGYEQTVSRQISLNADILWAPYMFKKNETVFRALIGSLDVRYYFNPKYYYTNDQYDGFYLGPYIEGGNFNIGLDRGEGRNSKRYKGWGISTGVSFGYKFYLSKRFRLDLNVGVGYAHLQYDTYKLGGEWANVPLSLKDTRAWVGPTKFGVHLVYNLFR